MRRPRSHRSHRAVDSPRRSSASGRSLAHEDGSRRPEHARMIVPRRCGARDIPMSPMRRPRWPARSAPPTAARRDARRRQPASAVAGQRDRCDGGPGDRRHRRLRCPAGRSARFAVLPEDRRGERPRARSHNCSADAVTACRARRRRSRRATSRSIFRADLLGSTSARRTTRIRHHIRTLDAEVASGRWGTHWPIEGPPVQGVRPGRPTGHEDRARRDGGVFYTYTPSRDLRYPEWPDWQADDIPVGAPSIGHCARREPSSSPRAG